MANVSVSNTPGLYIGSGASAVLNSAQQLLSLLSNQGNVNFSLATGNATVQGFFIGNVDGTYSNANVAAYLPVNSANVAGSYFIGDGSQLTNLPIGPSSYGNANVAAYLPTYTGSLALSSTIVTLDANVGTLFLGNASTNANLGAFQTFSNANAASQATAINTLNANLGAFQTYANSTFGTSSYGNANVAAYLPTYTGTLDNSSTIVNLVANAATQATAINTINANLGTATNNITTLFSNAAAQSIDITTLFSNAATQQTEINTLNANLGAFQIYANATFSTGGGSSYGNANVAAFLPTYSGNIGNADVKSGSQNWYGGTMTVQANAATAAGGTLNLKAGNVSNSIGGTINVSAANITLGGDYYATDLIQVNAPMRFNQLSAGTPGANVAIFQQGNVVLNNESLSTGNRSNYGGYLFVDNAVRAGSFIGDGSQLSNIPSGNVLGVATSQTQILGGNLTANISYTSNLFVKAPPTAPLSSHNGFSQIQQVGTSASNGGGGSIELETYSQGGTANSTIDIFANSDGVNGGVVTIRSATAPTQSGLLSGVVRFTANTIDVQGNIVSNANVTTSAFFVGDGSYLTNLPAGTYGNTQVAAFLPTYTGNIGSTLSTFVSAAQVDVTGQVNIVGNINLSGLGQGAVNTDYVNATQIITAANFIGDGSGLTNVSAAPWGDYQGSGFQSIQADSALLTFNTLGAIASGNLTNGISSIVGTINDPNWSDGPYAFMSAQASNYFDGSANQATIFVPRPGVSANTSVVNGAQWSTTWGNIFIAPQGATSPEIYEFSNVGIRFPDGTVQSTAAAGGGSNFTSNLTVNGNYIIDANLSLARDQVANIGTILGTTTINANIGQIQTAVVSGNITINTNNFTNFLPGQSVTIKLRQATNSNLRILTSNVRYAGGSKTLSTANAAIDTITITYDGEDYLGALVKGYS